MDAFNRTQQYLGGYTAQLEQELDLAQQRIHELEAQLRRRDYHGDQVSLEEQLEEKDQVIQKLENWNGVLRKEVETQKDETTRMVIRVKELERELIEKDDAIAELTKDD